ncbi:MAG TPA: 5-formyltetrahydrofolate cyclo-ligase [Gemmatimonadales bacterium]|nr:5-formyltetrahydrofolate cyclo-ligase [Gemmatimonadales bacterium]
MTDKSRLRSLMLERRDRANDRMAHSAAIGRHVTGLDEYAAAETIAWFVGVKSEVMTLPMIADALAARRRVALPWVSPDGLCLALVGSLEEVAPAPFGLLEPRDEIRQDLARQVAADRVDFYVVPGVAFDRHGGRLGHGKAYYDRLLAHARPDATLAGLCFEVQLVDKVPMAEHDVLMNYVVTEKQVYTGDRGSRK